MAGERCPGCGHNFHGDSFPGSGGLCKWCIDEKNNPSQCYVCGAGATCSGHNGYLCSSSSCSDADDHKSKKKYQEQYGDD